MAIESPNPPHHLLLGNDAYEAAMAKLEELRKDFSAWEAVSRGADFPKKSKESRLEFTHLGLTPASRLNQARVLVGPEWLNCPECHPPVILCGDFNTQPGSVVFKLLEERLGYVEALKVNGQKDN